MSLPLSLSAYADIAPVLSAAIEAGGLRIPRAALPPSKSNDANPTSRGEYFRFRFYNFRKKLATTGDPRADFAFSFLVEVDPLGDVILRPRTLDLSAITDLAGNPISTTSHSPTPLSPDDIEAEAEALRTFLSEDD